MSVLWSSSCVSEVLVELYSTMCAWHEKSLYESDNWPMHHVVVWMLQVYTDLQLALGKAMNHAAAISGA